MRGLLGSSYVAEAEFVPTATGAADGCAKAVAADRPFTEAAGDRQVSSASRLAAPSRVQVVQEAQVVKGFSEQAARMIATSQKPSSLEVYERKWRGFVKWCNDNNVNPLSPTVSKVADFLCSLHQKGIAISTIECYRTAISNTVKLTHGLDIGHNAELSALLANMARSGDVGSAKVPPTWDLSVMLHMLLRAPYEPLHNAGGGVRFMHF